MQKKKIHKEILQKKRKTKNKLKSEFIIIEQEVQKRTNHLNAQSISYYELILNPLHASFSFFFPF